MKTRKQTKKHIVTPEKHLGIVKTTTPNGYKLLKYKASCVAGNYYNLTTVHTPINANVALNRVMV